MSGRHPDQRSHPDDASSFSLDELASEADVTPRTIRYYIAEGLLPPPDSPGRNARYSQEHLDRLRLIASMKDRYLPLKEIRRTLASMPPERISRMASEASVLQASESRRPPEPTPASDYIAHALEESQASYRVPEPRARRRSPRPQPDTHQRWRRIPVSDEAELLISDDAWRRRGEQIESALDWIRRILNE
jgi:DNA-binding transcriptional MerR regulator